jgi:hypothetical protein
MPISTASSSANVPLKSRMTACAALIGTWTIVRSDLRAPLRPLPAGAAADLRAELERALGDTLARPIGA